MNLIIKQKTIKEKIKSDSYFQIRFSFFKVKNVSGKFVIYIAGSSYPHNYPDGFKKYGSVDTLDKAIEFCHMLA
jgi:hypothetical protein